MSSSGSSGSRFDEELEEYGDGESTIESRDAKIPGWLKLIYLTLPIWGIIWLFLYWNGVHGWLDRGYWLQLEKAANTTFPNVNYIEVEKEREEAAKN